jgi:hypothetical protein
MGQGAEEMPWAASERARMVSTCSSYSVVPKKGEPKDYGSWLDPGMPGAEELLRPCPAEWIEAVPVSTRVSTRRTMPRGSFQTGAGTLKAQGMLL